MFVNAISSQRPRTNKKGIRHDQKNINKRRYLPLSGEIGYLPLHVDPSIRRKISWLDDGGDMHFDFYCLVESVFE